MMMELSKFMFLTLSIIQGLVFHQVDAANSNLFREYIGAEFKNVKFSDVPINPNTNFHFILSFAIDYTTDQSNPSSTFGKFNVFWDTSNLNPSAVSSIKRSHSNVKVALSLGGDSVANTPVYFVNPPSIDYWVANAVSSLTSIIRQYNLDGIDIDYERFRKASPYTFAECIGKLITTLKRNNVISFASIAPFDGEQAQRHYKELWSRYGYAIDYVNFQFYAYESGTTVPQFLSHFRDQKSNYPGAKILVSFTSAGGGGLSPENGFFTACKTLKDQQQLYGIFIWAADDSMSRGFQYERQSQALLT